MKLEEYLDEEFGLMRVTPYIMHLKQPADTIGSLLRCRWSGYRIQESYYNAVTVAMPRYEEYRHLSVLLSGFYLEARSQRRSDLGTIIVEGFAKRGCGVALCHHLDQFNRQRGRIIAKGRLLKVLRAKKALLRAGNRRIER